MKNSPEDRSDSPRNSSNSSERLAQWRRYNQSPKGKARRARYIATPGHKMLEHEANQRNKLYRRLYMQRIRGGPIGLAKKLIQQFRTPSPVEKIQPESKGIPNSLYELQLRHTIRATMPAPNQWTLQ